jgi:APA family basic amino acid/polyamine antiporter
MIAALDRQTQLTALAWMVIGLVFYFLYGRTHSKLAVPEKVAPVGSGRR